MLSDSSQFDHYDAVLSQSPLFRGTDRAFLLDKLLLLESEHYARNEEVLNSEQAGQKFCILMEGRVKLVSRAEGTEREITLFLLGPGDAFDVVSLLEQRVHDVYAEALDDVTVLWAPTEHVRQWIAEHPAFNQTFLPYLGRQMALLSELATDLTLHDTGVRLARLILRHVDPTSPEHEVRLINNLSHDELAKMIGTVRVVANRQIQNLKRQGIIDARRGHLVVKDLEGLIQESHGILPRQTNKNA